MAIFNLFLFAIVVLSRQSLASLNKTCKYVPTDSNWPSVSAWNTFNTTVSGQLIEVQPVAISCYPGPLSNNETCAEVNSNWIRCAWQAEQPAGYCIDTGTLTCPPVVPPAAPAENCTIGNNPIYTVNATAAEHVAAGIKFAAENNVRLIVKTTGHDFLHRSEGFGSLQIWLRYFRTGIDFYGTFQSRSSCASSNWTGSAIRIGGGYQWSDVYAVAKANNVVIVGGGAASIGAIGGWLQGGGYGAATHEFGIGADQLLEAEVALADGSIVTASPCQNVDVYSAIRGGGPSTYGVVLAATFKTYPMVSAAGHRISFAFSPAKRDLFLNALTVLYSSIPDLMDGGYAIFGFWGQSDGSLVGAAPPGYFHNAYMMNKTVAEAQAVFAPVEKKLADLGVNITIAWASYDSYWSLFETVSNNGDDPGFPLGVNYSRFFDRKALQNSTDSLREMLDVVAGDPEDGTFHSNSCMSGGQVWKDADQPLSSAHPAWRTSYCLQITQRIWPEGSDDAFIAAVKQQVTFVKGGAMTELAPDTGTYMNEAGREDPEWKANFYGSNYDRLLGIKKRRDPQSVFYCPTCVGSDEWVIEKTGRLCQV